MQANFEGNNGHMSKIADSDDEEYGVGGAYSSAALSRRAEIILANAKKRLNLMEGNLRGARDALPTPLTFQNLARAASVGSHDVGSNRRLVSGTTLTLEKHRALNALNESRARDMTRTEEDSSHSRQAMTRNESNDEESEYEDAEETRHRSRPVSSLLESPVSSRTRYTNQSQESETDGESIYEEPEYQPVAERHEDRADAFDYQNFFLHSAVGTYGQPTRRSSVSSTGSADTARGPAPNDSQEPPATPETPEALRKIERAMHRRALSKDSVASMATFATAAEGHDDESKGQHPSQGHNWPIPAIEAHRLNRQTNGQRTDSGYGSAERRVGKSDASTFPLSKYYNHYTVDQASQNAVDAAVSALVKSAASPATPRSAMSVDSQDLVHGLVRSLQQVCVRLQETSGNQYESRIWRRRLDEAKRVLDGNQEGEAY
ncbi:hypothetical protein B0A49_05350 [Cryomyces minteri]|uniref:Uncharacterized protein n=1 Tax=Cryomyces minteri TaxID=331657 RepID=A0A4U0WYH7_9PEZI|nr:hypothetical protein B0A49_05350 [Cryomyces minteri]